MPKFEPVREDLYAMVMKSSKEVVLAKFPGLDLDFLETEDDEVEDTASKAAELGSEGKPAAGDEAGTSKGAEAEGKVKGDDGEVAKGDEGEATKDTGAEEAGNSKVEKTSGDAGDVNPQA